jgi:hypothetical protein
MPDILRKNTANETPAARPSLCEALELGALLDVKVSGGQFSGEYGQLHGFRTDADMPV